MLREYQSSLVLDEDGIAIEKDEFIEEKLMKEIEKIVNAIIFTNRFQVFEDIDDLRQHAMKACYENFKKFNPDKGTCFSYFSVISRICLINYTGRRKKHRNHQDIDDQVHLHGPSKTNYNIFFDELEDTLFAIIDENFVGNKRKKYIRIASVIIQYLRNTRKFVSKSDLYAFARSYSFKNTEVRAFIKDINKYNGELFEVVS